MSHLRQARHVRHVRQRVRAVLALASALALVLVACDDGGSAADDVGTTAGDTGATTGDGTVSTNDGGDDGDVAPTCPEIDCDRVCGVSEGPCATTCEPCTGERVDSGSGTPTAFAEDIVATYAGGDLLVDGTFTELVPSPPQWLDLAIASDGTRWLGYQIGRDLRVAFADELGPWSETLIAQQVDAFALTVDNQRVPWLVVAGSENGEPGLWILHRPNDTWEIAASVSADAVTAPLSVAILSTNVQNLRIQVAWMSADGFAHYGVLADGILTTETMGPAGGDGDPIPRGDRIALAFDSFRTTHAAYLDADGRVVHARKIDGEWVPEALSALGETVASLDMVVSELNDALFVAWRTSSGIGLAQRVFEVEAPTPVWFQQSVESAHAGVVRLAIPDAITPDLLVWDDAGYEVLSLSATP